MMTVQCGEVQYDDNERLNFGSQVYINAAEIRTCILLPQLEEALPEEADVQAECIADTICDMLQKKFPVLLSGGQQRPCEPKDFCILLRSVKTHGDAMTAALKRRGIPVMADRESGLLALPEIRLIWNLLRIIDNQMTDAAMAAVLFSPVYGFTVEDLALLKLHGKRRRLYLQLRTVAEKQEIASLCMRCKAFLEQLHELRRIAEQTSLEDCIQAVYDATDLLSLQGLYEDGAQRREHLEAFRQEAQRYRENADLSAQSCLSGWLRYLERLTEAQKDIEIKVSAGDSNCVFVKTIHKSKGLEYPFVFVAHLDQRFNTGSDAKSAIQASEDGLLGLYLYDRERYQKAQSITFQYLLGSARKRQKSEELRLLYVALTRAEQQLFLVMDKAQRGAVKSGTAACNL
ncbi:MAG: hypothetical protein K2I93_06665, partial [Oscillospiraceae bacterium]|nr:hypothetical protein [Oscillospiraceae bacterium]